MRACCASSLRRARRNSTIESLTGGVLSQIGAGALAGALELQNRCRTPGGGAAEHGVGFGEFASSAGSVGADGVVGDAPVVGDVSQGPVVGVGVRHGSSFVSA